MRKILLSGLLILFILIYFSNSVVAPETSCTDSDGGLDYYIKGEVTQQHTNGATTSYIDCCAKDCNPTITDPNALVEMDCNLLIEGDSISEIYSCPNGCSDGACSVKCEGIEMVWYVEGEEARRDPACDSDRSNCYNCDGFCYSFASDTCGGYRCLTGNEINPACYTFQECIDACDSQCVNIPSANEQCVGGTTCTDTDGGKDYYVKGYVTYEGYEINGTLIKEYDKCAGVIILQEKYCPEIGGLGTIDYECPNGCSDGACVEGECVGEGGSLGAVVPDNVKECCSGLTPIIAAEHEGGGACSILVGSRGYCSYCGDGVCKEPENLCNCPTDCKYTEKCPYFIDISVNKHDYYPGDYFELSVKIYDQNENLMPNQVFTLYVDRFGTSSTHSTDSTGVYKQTSIVPDNPEYSGEWTLLVSVEQEGCEYISDKDRFYIHITNECGDGYCNANERELVCETVCAEVDVVQDYEEAPKLGTMSPFAVTGGITATSGSGGYATPVTTAVPTQISETVPSYCKTYCHVKCQKDCTPNCGNGVCEQVVCEAEGCPVPENERNCPADCATPNYCGSRSTDSSCICEAGYRKEKFEEPCLQPYPTEMATGSVTGGVTATSGECYASGTECCRGDGACAIATPAQCDSGALPEFSGCSDDCVPIWRCEEKCAEEGEYTSGAVGPEYYFGCCEGLKAYDTHPGGAGFGLLCYDPNKGVPVCKHQGTRSEGWYYWGTEELLRYEDCSSERMCTYYRCVPSYKYLYLHTDKFGYDLNEPVQIETNTFEAENLEREKLTVSVKGPYGTLHLLTLEPVCGSSSICVTCEPGTYCPPCKTQNVCKYSGTFTGTDAVGSYVVSPASDLADYVIKGTSFRVYDKSALEKFLILRNIDGYIYKDAQFIGGIGGESNGYMATYEKDSRGYGVIVYDFENREALEAALEIAFKQIPPVEKKIDGYYIYVFKNYGVKVYAWTHRTFLIAVMENMPITATAGTGFGIGGSGVTHSVPDVGSTDASVMIEQDASDSGFFTGMITGMPIAEAEQIPVYCGQDSLHRNCICKADETKEEFTPPCLQAPCEQHYRCRLQDPRELIIAYLDKYPSDIKAAGTRCEERGGYCIGIENSCRTGFEEVSISCKTSAEICCVKEVDRDDFLEMVMKLEGIRVRMDSLERKAIALLEYYASVDDAERAEKFRTVAAMFGMAKDMIDDIITKIRENLDNLEGIRSEVKGDVSELRSYISGILERMVS